MWSFKPNNRSREIDAAKKRSRPFVITRRNPTILLELLEEVFDKMPPGVHVFVVASRLDTIRFRRDDRFHARFFENVQNTLLGVVGFVGEERFDSIYQVG